MWSDSSRLEWPEQDAIPPPTLREFQMVFRDIDYASRGWVTAAEVLAAFEINNLDLHPNDVARAVQGMVALSSREGDMGSASVAARDADSRITAVAFCRCLYALSRQQRELLPNEAYAVFPDSIFTHDSELGFLRVRRDIWLLLDAPSSSKAAQAVAAFLTAAIFLSTIAFCLETLPGLHRSHGDKFASIEAACVALFTLEFSLRLFCTPDLKAFVRSPLNWIDFFSIVPFYADVFISGWDVAEDSDGLGSSILRAVRLVRVFRLLKTGRYLAWLRVFGATISESLSPLFMVGTVTCIIVTFLSSVEYFFERGRWGVVPGANVPLTNGTGSMAPSGLDSGSAWINSDGDLSSFQSIPATFWWCIITLTGVGYGDVYPVTPGGKAFAAACFFCGIVLSSIPISLISGNFHDAYMRMERMAAIKAVHQAQHSEANASCGVDQSTTVASSEGAAAAAASEGSAATLSLEGAATGNASVAAESSHAPEEAHDTSFLFLSEAEIVDEAQALAETQARIDASWSEPFLRSAIIVIRNSRRGLMSKLKSLELGSREHLDEDLRSLIVDLGSEDRAKPIVERALAAGLA